MLRKHIRLMQRKEEKILARSVIQTVEVERESDFDAGDEGC